MDTFIAERELSYQDVSGITHTVLLKVGKPFPDGKGAWCCEYCLGAPLQISGKAYGQDGLQALLLGLAHARARLEFSQEFRGRVSWLDQEDLGLPSALSEANTKHLAFIGKGVEASSIEQKKQMIQVIEKDLHRLNCLLEVIQRHTPQ